jgi:hypothetical protein
MTRNGHKMAKHKGCRFFKSPVFSSMNTLCPVGCLSLAFLNWDSQQGRDKATSGRIFFLIGQILFLSNFDKNYQILILCLSTSYYYVQ